MTDDTPTPLAQAYLEALRRLLDAEEGRGEMAPEEARSAADKAGEAWETECGRLAAKEDRTR